MEMLENIPDGNIAFQIDGYYMETTEITDKMIAWMRVYPATYLPV
jgi:Mg2+/Co2+ transporter CorB